MASTESKVRDLVNQHLSLDREPDFDVGLGESDVSSVDAVAFVKKVGEAFGVEIPAEKVAQFQNLRDLVNYLDSQAA